MDSQNHPYHLSDRNGNTGSPTLAPVSAFSAYSLLRNCNYYFASQAQETNWKKLPDQSERSEGPPVISSSLCSEKSLLNLPTKPFLSVPLCGYPRHFQLLQPGHSLHSRSANVISPSSFYNTAFGRKQRGEKKPIPAEQKDEKYFERRRRNNQAAKKSRDARKIREDQIALKASILEHENAILRAQLLTVREEASSLRQLLLQKKAYELATRDNQICIS